MIKDFFQFEGYLPESRIKQRALSQKSLNIFNSKARPSIMIKILKLKLKMIYLKK
jgi:hypothetical protein